MIVTEMKIISTANLVYTIIMSIYNND